MGLICFDRSPSEPFSIGIPLRRIVQNEALKACLRLREKIVDAWPSVEMPLLTKGSRLTVINVMLMKNYVIFTSAIWCHQRKPHEDDHHTCGNCNDVHERNGHVGLQFEVDDLRNSA